MTTTSPRRPARPPARRHPRGTVSTSSRERFAARARARRLEVARRGLLVLLVLGLVAGLAWVVGWSSLLALRSVAVEAAVLSTDDDGAAAPALPGALRDDVLAAADAPLGRPMLRVDTDAVRERVAALPEVAAVEVDRAWWSRGLEVRVEPRVPVAVVPDGSGYRLVDRDGLAYLRVPETPTGVPQLDVAAGESAQAERAAAVAVLAALPPDLAATVAGVAAESPDDVRLRLATGAEVVWGSADRSERKAQVLGLLLREPANVYDVSAPDRPATRAG